MTNVIGHGDTKYVGGSRLVSSHGRAWTGLLAERWSLPKGDLGDVMPRDTEVIVLLEGRLKVRRPWRWTRAISRCHRGHSLALPRRRRRGHAPPRRADQDEHPPLPAGPAFREHRTGRAWARPDHGSAQLCRWVQWIR